MTTDEKKRAREPWKHSVIIKLVGKRISFHLLHQWIQALWKLTTPFLLIDLANDFYIVKLSSKRDQDATLFNGPWMNGSHYLHVRRWEHNFVAATAEIKTLPVWIHFLELLVEYYSEEWLHYAGNKIGKMLMVDDTTRTTARAIFACVCVEVDLTKPLQSAYTLRGRSWPIQYGGLHLVCFRCGKYRYFSTSCPSIQQNSTASEHDDRIPHTPQVQHGVSEASKKQQHKQVDANNPYGPWMFAQTSRRCSANQIATGLVSTAR